MTLKKIDLHSHTTCSDGVLTPVELICRAQNMQVDVLAITDHDTLEGVLTAHNYLQKKTDETNKKPSIQLVSGIELSTSWHGFDIHIVGLNIDHNDKTLSRRVAEQQVYRASRAVKICEKVEKCGHKNVHKTAVEIAQGAQVTRSHIAKAMVQLSICDSVEKAFKLYLGKGKKAQVSPKWISIGEAIMWIHQAGGQAVLAHPAHYDMTTKWLRRLIAEFAALEGDAIELAHPRLAPEKRKMLTALCIEHNLKGSAGSDFHFPNKWTELGRNLNLPDNIEPIWASWHDAA